MKLSKIIPILIIALFSVSAYAHGPKHDHKKKKHHKCCEQKKHKKKHYKCESKHGNQKHQNCKHGHKSNPHKKHVKIQDKKPVEIGLKRTER